MANLRRMSGLINVLTGMRKLKEGPDVLGEEKKVIDFQNAALRNLQLRRELAGPSPGERYSEEQRSRMVGSSLEMFSQLYRTASPASKKLLGEQMGSLWGLMDEGERSKYKMIVSHTPLNPKVQKAMWFEEVNPRPSMPIVREGDGSYTNNPPRSAEYRKIWAEYDIATYEWDTLRKMAVEGKGGEVREGWKNVPYQAQTDDVNVTAYRDSIDRKVKFFNWKGAEQAEVATAIEKGWATQSDMMRTGNVPISTPREYMSSGNPVTIRQVRDVVRGVTKLEYDYAGPPKEEDVVPPKELTDAIHLIDNGIEPRKLKIKSPAVIGFYAQLQDVIKSRGRERLEKQRAFQLSLVDKYPSPKRFIAFVPPPERANDVMYKIQWLADWIPGLAFFVPTPSPGKQGNIALVPADRLVLFSDRKGVEMEVWWSDVFKIAYDIDGAPIRETRGKIPGDRLDLEWSK